MGGTVLATGSQEWVRSQIQAAVAAGSAGGAGGARVDAAAFAAAAADSSSGGGSSSPSADVADVGNGAVAVKGLGLPHKELNQMCIDHMLRLARSERVWIPLDKSTKPCGPEAVAAAAPSPPPADTAEPGRPLASLEDGLGYTLHQVCGKAGDVLLMHPWLIHCGSINCGT